MLLNYSHYLMNKFKIVIKKHSYKIYKHYGILLYFTKQNKYLL